MNRLAAHREKEIPSGAGLGRSGVRVHGERLAAWLLGLCAAVSVLLTVGIVLVLTTETMGFFGQVSVWEFVTGTSWAPLFQEKSFGILPLLWGSVMVALGASLLAVPLGVLSALYLSEYATPGARVLLKPLLEVLAGIPTVVYGYLALTLVTPILRALVPGTGIFNAASASVVVGIMILPTVMTLSEEAFRGVPRSLREAAFSLGATKMEVATRVVLPAGLSGVIASFLLALSRAMGETMAVTIAAGSSPQLTLNPLDAVQTLTAYIAQVGMGSPAAGTLEYRTLFAVGMTLFLLTLAMNLLGQWVRIRFREAAW
jgi:phosphate transport system permease protein